MAEWAGQWAGLAGSYTRGVVKMLVELPGMTVCSDPDLTLDQARSLKLGRCPTPSIVLISPVSPGCSGLRGLRVLLLPARGGQRHLAGRGGRHRHRHLLPPHGECTECRHNAVLYLHLSKNVILRLQAITMNIGGRQFGGQGQRRRRREAAGSSVVSGGGVS